ncbi:MAG TPA: acyl-CoA dehydrogenase family protein [Microthrixaceae bacterium]|nr:acyl-CoA dehydrogenase family protein [Microthrixaceae bacterium]
MNETATTTVESDEELVIQRVEELLQEFPPASTSEQRFLEAQFDKGLAWVHFPEGHGGLGVSPKLQRTVIQLVSAAGGPIGGQKNPIGYGMCAPAVMTHGTDSQWEMLRPLFSNEHIWCQMFSEPGAGSDVASLAMKAERDGDEWILNGQKVWTTLAHISSYGLVIARTNPDLPKHKGITAFIVDIHAPGVDVRPLRQMTGEAEFNEVYLTDVRIHDSMRLDDVGRGWAVSITTLMNERVSIGGGVPPKGSGPIGQLIDVWSGVEDKSAALRDNVTKLWIQAEVNRLTNIRSSQMRKSGTPGPEGSFAKLAMAELNKDIYSLAIDLLGPSGMLYESYDFLRPSHALFGDDMYKNFLRARANSIEGGTSEVLRNIIGERVLGLPGDVRVDKVVPWKEVPRN